MSDLQKQALAHAHTIEAACWSPHSRLTSDNYQALMSAKTNELCRAIIKKALPNFDLTHMAKTQLRQPPAATPPPPPKISPSPPQAQPSSVLPVPIVPPRNNSAPIDPYLFDDTFEVKPKSWEDIPFTTSFEYDINDFKTEPLAFPEPSSIELPIERFDDDFY